MNIELFNTLVEATKQASEEIKDFLWKELQLVKYEDHLEVIDLQPFEEFQSDCDGDDNNISCTVKLSIKTPACQVLFKKFAADNEYRVLGLKFEAVNDIIYGDRYNFTYCFYDITK